MTLTRSVVVFVMNGYVNTHVNDMDAANYASMVSEGFIQFTDSYVLNNCYANLMCTFYICNVYRCTFQCDSYKLDK